MFTSQAAALPNLCPAPIAPVELENPTIVTDCNQAGLQTVVATELRAYSPRPELLSSTTLASPQRAISLWMSGISTSPTNRMRKRARNCRPLWAYRHQLNDAVSDPLSIFYLLSIRRR